MLTFCTSFGSEFWFPQTILSHVVPFWDSLTTLTLGFPVAWDWHWGVFDGELATPSWAIPIIDDILPPIRRSTGCTQTLAEAERRLRLRHVHDPESHVEVLHDELRALFGLAPHDELSPDMPLMSAWEARHNTHVAYAVRLLAEAAPNISEVRWHITLLSMDPINAPSWLWRIERGTNGLVNQVVGNLAWKGKLSGDPEPLRTLVGQELAWVQNNEQ
jgi:hypothetical protein